MIMLTSKVIRTAKDLSIWLTPKTSAASSDGTRYFAYMLDIGLFPNAAPRDFQQVEPGQVDDSIDKIR